GKHFSFAIGNAFTAHPVGAWFFVFGIIGFIVLCTVWTVITVIWISQALTGNKPPRAAAAE
ncbi:MAG TPA: hypothetical protein VKJ65_11125, partial [Phycisphaerae bacterium]|nr:hypothetical protein [Phycisphaerae bacterium]